MQPFMLIFLNPGLLCYAACTAQHFPYCAQYYAHFISLYYTVTYEKLHVIIRKI